MTEEVALYRLYDAAGRLLYVGVAKDIGRRFAGHRADKGWWGDVCDVNLVYYPSRGEALTAESAAIRSERPLQLPPAPPILPLHAKPAYGAVEGRIQTMSNRGGVRFTLFDTLNDRAVQCYLYKDQQHLIENMWGRRASVEGLVTRDPVTGRPLSIRRITAVEALPEGDANRWRNARGASPSVSRLSPEAAIRKVRDEW